MTASAADLLRVAQGQLGYVEGGGSDGRSGNVTKFGAAYGMNGVAWCSEFVWWCFSQIGVDVKREVTESYASADAAMRGFLAHGWEQAGHPKPGDVVFFHFSGEHSGANHTGIVVGSDAGGVTTIEGNTSSGNSGSQSNGGGVYRRYRPYSVIIGYGRYPFPAANVPVVPASPAKAYPTLWRNDGSGGAADPKNHDVRRLQNLLHIAVTGVYDTPTEKAVRSAQARLHLVVDGKAGPGTLNALGF